MNDVQQLSDGVDCAVRVGCRWRGTRVVRRDADAERARANREAQGRVEHQRLAVDTGRNGPVGRDLERSRRPLPPRDAV